MSERMEYFLAEILDRLTTMDEHIVQLAEAIAGKRQQVEKEIQQEQVEAPIPSFEPEPEPEAVTLADLRDLFAEKGRAGHKQRLFEILGEFGASKIPQVPEDQYSALAEKVRAL